ncbi:MAG: signal recognition particle-docking protein FtsY [Armatimonadota bacterium]
MKVGLFKGIRERIGGLFSRARIDDALFEELEDALIEADVPVAEVEEVLEALRADVKRQRIEDPSTAKERLALIIAERLRDAGAPLSRAEQPPTVYLFLGVNGSGKTTTIAKLAHRLVKSGESVLVAAGDTFRAAAIEQLEAWAERVGASIVRSKPGADPGAVVFDAIAAAKARGIDFVLADTAGRQHTRDSLMQELAKVVSVATKALGRSPDEVLLVIDGNTGQNAIRQAEQFAKVAGVTGVVVTKLDGTPRGGAILGIRAQLGTPVKLVGVGERPEDLEDFDPDAFAREIVG